MNSTIAIPPELVASLRAFRFSKSKTSQCLIIKIDTKTLVAQLEKTLADAELADLPDELPDVTPRFIVLSYRLEHADGRVSFPLIGFNYCPPGASDLNRMLYASARNQVFQAADISKVVDLVDVEDLTMQFIEEQAKGKK